MILHYWDFVDFLKKRPRGLKGKPITQNTYKKTSET